MKPHIKMAKKEGVGKRYDESGRLREEQLFKKDVAEGLTKIYLENGRLWGQILYKNNEPVSGTCANGRALTNIVCFISVCYCRYN